MTPKILGPMTLRAYLGRHGLQRDVRGSTIEQYGYAIGALERWNGESVTLDMLTDDLLNAWIGFRLERGDSRKTIKNQAGAITTLWRFACEDGLVETVPRRVKRIKAPPPI